MYIYAPHSSCSGLWPEANAGTASSFGDGNSFHQTSHCNLSKWTIFPGLPPVPAQHFLLLQSKRWQGHNPLLIQLLPGHGYFLPVREGKLPLQIHLLVLFKLPRSLVVSTSLCCSYFLFSAQNTLFYCSQNSCQCKLQVNTLYLLTPLAQSQ